MDLSIIFKICIIITVYEIIGHVLHLIREYRKKKSAIPSDIGPRLVSLYHKINSITDPTELQKELQKLSDEQYAEWKAQRKRLRKITLRKSVKNFAERMEVVLQTHDDKGGWEGCFIDGDLFPHLQEEVEELERVLDNESWTSIEGIASITNECVDVANMAMMISDALNEKVGK